MMCPLSEVFTMKSINLAVIEGVKPEGVGLAIMNRLIRACEYDYKIF